MIEKDCFRPKTYMIMAWNSKSTMFSTEVVLVSHLDGDLINIEFLNLRKILKILTFPWR